MPSGLELYPHNEKAYRKLLDMLSGTRRACIIHPTGTGKAFIAYRYAFDHPNERILWMSPSTYIEQEQEASIRRELPNHEFKNIERMTYQTAMHRAQKGNLDIHADTVIFDEFHHTGAPQWSRGVEGVIECNPDANLIGLSATSIRYSDSGRDMSDELFDGHIASYMSLTDCWICWRESMNVAHMIVHVTCTIFSVRSRAVGSTRVFTSNTWFHLPFQENVNCVLSQH